MAGNELVNRDGLVVTGLAVAPPFSTRAAV
jgi:hypothetical protein